MPMLEILALALGMTLGSLLAATLLTYLAWWIANRVHHRRWGWALMLGMIGGVWFGISGHGEFFKMAAVFGLVGSVALYFGAHAMQSEPSSGDAKQRLAGPGEGP